ncbi:hypothetical protein GCM10011578_083200 [Streptomyces fuscichromogenes]|uniref:Uncharacterized protein n=1 Tax=Streptomyces fuscichromogenes TaxID=1324013 RepID=A0A917XLV3_9ACTN|nr:hypothetical protein GCM10011578_083200 [Streptomyces fuscichromogenes]
MTTETSGCFRPHCRFSPTLRLTRSGSLEISSWCSDACRDWTVAAVANARSEFTPETEREAHRLCLIRQLLDIRDNADDVTFSAPTTPVTAPATDETEA